MRLGDAEASMPHKLLLIVGTILILAAGLSVAAGQDFRVDTTIQNLAAASNSRGDKGNAPVIGRSRTLFHAGKVYDYLPEIGEVIVIDFATENRHYRLLNTRRELTASIHFDEVRKLLQEAIATADQSIARMEESGDPRFRDAVSLHRFQRSAHFKEQFSDNQRQLSLSSALIHYGVDCEKPAQPGFVESYCRYADAVCSLNYVLHPGVLLPEPRIVLNDALRRRGVLPTSVQLDVNQSQRVSLRAMHQFRWELDQSDRHKIDHWESMLSSPTVRRVSAQDYQKEVVRAVAKASKSRTSAN
jgi:hypothetical protein